MEFHKHILHNGLTVIGEHNPAAKSVAVGYFVKTGARDEQAEVSGVSHFLEHMLFKGNAQISGWEINAEFDAIGAKYNAFTSEEITAYHGAVLPEYQGRLLKLLTQMMRPALKVDDFEVEKKVILEEIEMYKDRPSSLVFDEVRPLYFGSHPLGNSVLGSTGSITDLSRDQMHGYWQARYAPNNLTLGLAGNYDWFSTLEQLELLTQNWPVFAQTITRPKTDFVPRAQSRVLEQKQLNRAHLAIMAPGFSSSDPRRYAAGVLGTILGLGENSRLYWALMDNGFVEEASLDHTSEEGLGHFDGYVCADPDRAVQALEVYRATLQDAQNNGVTLAELERAKRKLAVSLVLRAETPYSRLFALGLEYIESQSLQSLQDVVKTVQAITLDDLQAILETRPFDHLTVVGLGPISSLD